MLDELKSSVHCLKKNIVLQYFGMAKKLVMKNTLQNNIYAALLTLAKNQIQNKRYYKGENMLLLDSYELIS